MKKNTIETLAINFLEMLVGQDLDGMMQLWHPQGSLEFPFAKDGDTSSINGIDALKKYFESMFSDKITLDYQRSNLFHNQEETKLFFEFKGNHKTENGTFYTCNYCAMVEVKDKRIFRFREYYDSLVKDQFEG
ncbi:MAG: nuclear transport factor 2 family protein [Nonlabens sp.]